MVLCEFDLDAEPSLKIVIYEELRSYWAYLVVDSKIVCDTWILNRGVATEETSYPSVKPPDCHNHPSVCRYHLLENELKGSDFRAFTNPETPQSYAVYYKSVLVASLKIGNSVGCSAFAEVDSALALAMDIKPDLPQF